ncbi:hypothetical protein B0H13DRAFT_1883899 [Mycena leptocephala]|nr:hypothetical protein B0H13DRAFT_1883899 [Mycena leptocephala]
MKNEAHLSAKGGAVAEVRGRRIHAQFCHQKRRSQAQPALKNAIAKTATSGGTNLVAWSQGRSQVPPPGKYQALAEGIRDLACTTPQDRSFKLRGGGGYEDVIPEASEIGMGGIVIHCKGLTNVCVDGDAKRQVDLELAVEDLPVLEDEATTGSSTRDIAAVDAEEQKAVKRLAALKEKLQRLESDIIALQVTVVAFVGRPDHSSNRRGARSCSPLSTGCHTRDRYNFPVLSKSTINIRVSNTELEPRSMMTRSRSLRVNLKRKIPERDGVAAGSEPEHGPATVKRTYFPPRPLLVGSGSRNLPVGTGKMSRTRPPPVQRRGESQSLSQLQIYTRHVQCVPVLVRRN